MKSVFRHILTAALLAVGLLLSPALADSGTNPYRELYTSADGTIYYYALRDGRTALADTLLGLGGDTVTVRRSRGARGFSIGVIPDSVSATKTAATDSLRGFYRPVFFASALESDTGSAWMPLLFRTSSNDSAYCIDWVPGTQYWIEDFDPVYAPLHQFLFIGSHADTIPLKIDIEQIKIEGLP